MNIRVLAIVAGLAAAAVVALLLAERRPTPTPAGTAPPPPKAAEFKTTGNYSDDWQTHCAPLSGPAQADCTARLDTAYGKTDASPVPVPVPGNR